MHDDDGDDDDDDDDGDGGGDDGDDDDDDETFVQTSKNTTCLHCRVNRRNVKFIAAPGT